MWQYFFKISKISKFFDFCTNHERSIFAIKNFLFFSRKIAKIWRIWMSFSDSYKKNARAKTTADRRPTGWCFWKSENLPKFVQFRRFFTSFSNFQKTNFCTYHERSNFGIKNSSFFREKLPKLGGFVRYFQNVTKIFDRAKTAADWDRTGWWLSPQYY